MASIKIKSSSCIGCKKCIASCPFFAILINTNNKAEILEDKCRLCGSCSSVCPVDAISFEKDTQDLKDISKYDGVWVFCEQNAGIVKNVSFEILGQGQIIAKKLNCKLTAVLMGSHDNNLSSLGNNLIEYGADNVIIVEESVFSKPNDLLYANAMEKLVNKYFPNILLFGATSFGRSFAPRVAAKLRTGLTADCTVLDVDSETGLLLQTRPAFGGNLLATIICPNTRPQMATVRQKVFAMPKSNSANKGILIRETMILKDNSGLVINSQQKVVDSEDVNIGEYDIVIAVGKGIGNKKNIALASKLAKLLGGIVAVSRPLVDSAWAPYTRQVGQTGKTISPKLYIACGISGSVQHMAGVSANKIIAVNTDIDAPIFKYSDYAIVGDCIDFLECAIEHIEEKTNIS